MPTWKVAILYATDKGHTREVAERVAEVARAEGWHAEVSDVEDGSRALAGADGAILGAPVHMRRFQRRMLDFIREHRSQLDDLDAAFFAVSLAAASPDPRAREELATYARHLREASGWSPARFLHVGGVLNYPAYGPITRWIMRFLAGRSGLATDTSRAHAYTRWQEVDSFARDALAERLQKLEAGRAGA